MANRRFDPKKVRKRYNEKTNVSKITFYGKPLTQKQLEKYNAYRKNQENTVRVRKSTYKHKIPQGIRTKYFSAGTRYTLKSGHTAYWARPMTLRGGSNPNYNFRRIEYTDLQGKHLKTSSKDLWGGKVNKGGVSILKGPKEWLKQLLLAKTRLPIEVENYRVVIGRRALKIFQNSFKYKQFYSQGSQKWTPLAPYTIRKRAKRGNGSRILKEYGDLLQSLKFDESRMRVFTDIVPANSGKHKSRSLSYAGWHNEGEGTYGNGWGVRTPKPYIQRQFMGHSTYLDPFIDPFINKLMKLYLFDSVWLVKKY